jgi:hypothetical protein
MAHVKPCIENFNATYGSTEGFEARIQASELAFENCLKDIKDPAREAIFAASLLQHTSRMALGYAWDYHYKNPRTYGKKITNDKFTLSIADLHLGKIVFVPY